jgi:5-methyltetrahydropteroyltriglutamate--homocysteine methyltransferase
MITTTVGSYPKVAEGAYGTTLIGAISKWQRQELTEDGLETVFRDITQAVIREQEQAGVEVVTDGQIRWEDLVTPLARRLDGFEINGLSRWFNNNVYYRRPILHRPPVWKRPILVEEYRVAASCATKPVKAVLPGPYTFATLIEDRCYKKNRRALVRRLAEILHQEAAALAQAGAALIQFDEPAYGGGPTDVKLALEALAIAAHGVGAKTAVVTYFGSLNGALEPLLRAKVDVVGVDVVSDPGALAELKRARITKELVLGCVDARNTRLESVEHLHRIFRAMSRRVQLDRLTVSPNCGLEFLPHRQALAKMRRLVEAARTYTA